MHVSIDPRGRGRRIPDPHTDDSGRLIGRLEFAMVWGETASDRELSQRQLSVLLIVGLEGEVDHRVGDLADRLKVSKIAITRAVDRLEQFNYIRRDHDPNDGRSIIISRTATGNAYIRQLSRFAKRAETQAVYAEAA